MEVPPLLSLPEEAAPEDASPLLLPAVPEEVGLEGLLGFGLSGSSGRGVTVPSEGVLPAVLEDTSDPPGTTLGW